MEKVLDREFLNTIVWMNDFKLDFKSLTLSVLCIESDNTEVNYRITLLDISYFTFRQEDYESEFSIIDTFFERFNESSYVEFMWSERMKEFWILRFHSGIHHLVVGFRSLELLQI